MPTAQAAPDALQPVISQPVQPPPQAGVTLSPIQFVMNAQTFLFDDGRTLYGYSLNCLPLWTLTSRLHFNGWAAAGNDLYFQDGPVTLQYDLNALVSGGPPVPINAFNLSNKQGWTSQQTNPRDVATIFTPPDRADANYSAPVVGLGNPDGPQVFVLTADGKIIPFSTNMTVDPSQVFATGFTPGPLALFAASPRNALSLHFLSGNDLVTLDTAPLAVRVKQPPAGGAALCLKLASAIRPGSNRSAISLLAAGQTDPIVCSDSTAAPMWQLYVSRNIVALAAGLPACIGGTLKHTPLSAPVILPMFGAMFLVTLASDSAGTVVLDQYKLVHPLPGSSARNSWPLLGSQLAGIAPWLNGGAVGPVPFDPDSTLACYAASAEAFAFNDATCAEQLPPAVSRATQNMMKIAGPAPGSDPVAHALKDLCSIVSLLDSVAGFGYDARRLVSIVHNGLGTSIPGRQLCAPLSARGFTPSHIADALRHSAYAPIEVLSGLQPGSATSKWWNSSAQPAPGEVRPEIAEVGAALHLAGYPPAEVAASLRALIGVIYLGDIERAADTAMLFKGGYPDLSAEDVRQVLSGAGYSRKEYRLATYWAYRDPGNVWEAAHG